MKVLFAASEGAPFSKSGGLGDVIGALPFYLKKLGIDIKVILPKYYDIPHDLKIKIKWQKSITVPVGWRNQFCGIEILRYRDIDFYFIDNLYYFNRPGTYGYEDDGERFAFFSRSVLEILPHIDYQPDILHCHDWQTAMIHYLLKTQYQHRDFYKKIKTVYTIHNLKYQGIFSKEVLQDQFNGSLQDYNIDGVEYYGNISYMKGGINYCDAITTVSPTYAKEIQQPSFGEGLDGLLAHKKRQLKGIINGIDDEKYNPKADPYLVKNYSIQNLSDKQENKRALQKKLGLPVDSDVPIIGIVTRLVEQKGLDLLMNQLKELMKEDIQLVILGTGDKKYEEAFKQAENKYPKKISANIFFDEVLAQKIYGGCDFFLMPSRFEPCGLGQLIALRYGTIPIVRETGGLKDTVEPYHEASQTGNGFTFKEYDDEAMMKAIRRGIDFYKNKAIWTNIVKNAMKTKASWGESAKAYLALYESLKE